MMSRPAFVLLLLSCLSAGLARAAGLEVRVHDAAGKPVRDAIVYAIPASGPLEAKGARAARSAAVEQVDREFVPYVSAIQTGTAVSFPNRDAILHHVYSFSPAKTFEIKLYKGKSPSEIVFDRPGIIVLGCNIHDWMIGYVLVVSTPYFGKTGEDGIARLRDVPAGAYELRSWHPQQREEAPPQSLALAAAPEGRAAIALDIVPRKAKFKPPLDRLKY